MPRIEPDRDIADEGAEFLFTSALVDAFGGNAPHRGNALRTDELGVWLTTIVPRLAAPGKQTPQMTKSSVPAARADRLRPVRANRGLELDPRKVGAGFPSRQTRNAFARRRSCSNKERSRDVRLAEHAGPAFPVFPSYRRVGWKDLQNSFLARSLQGGVAVRRFVRRPSRRCKPRTLALRRRRNPPLRPSETRSAVALSVAWFQYR